MWEKNKEIKELHGIPKSIAYLQPDSELIDEIKVSFIDGGRYRGYIIGHKRLSSLEVTLPLNCDKPTIEDDFIASIKCMKFCIEWDLPPVPIPRWRVLPNMEDNTIKRRKWYNGYIFFKEHPLAIRSYISLLRQREDDIELELELKLKQEEAKNAIKKRSKLIKAYKKNKLLESENGNTNGGSEEMGSVVVLGPVTRSDARCYPPITEVPKEMLILRKAEERPFLEDWQ